MTNLRIIFGTLFATAVLALLTGCKKEDEIAVFSITGETSFYFEYDQTREIPYRSAHIASFGEPVAPEGWTVTRTATHIVITSPTEGNSAAEVEGKVSIAATTNDSRTFTRTIDVAVRIADEITAPANSYIVSEPGKRYKFNARRRGNENAQTLEPVAANLMWTTAGSAIGHVTLENGYLFFATADGQTLTEGNALVSTSDKDGNIVWSWHIWATGYDPAAEPDIVGSHTVMNRNLGAFANSNETPEEVGLSYGLFYQWGRKDPFIGPVAWNSTAPQPVYTAAGRAMQFNYAVSSEEYGTLEYAVSRPTTFIAGADEESDYDWLWKNRDNSLWSTSSKTVYDPCPAGWRVAPPAIWESFEMTGDYSYGWTFGEGDTALYYPAAGRRSFSPTLASVARNYTNIVNDEYGNGLPVGFYWSSDPEKSLEFNSDDLNTAVADAPRAGGFPVRCVVE